MILKSRIFVKNAPIQSLDTPFLGCYTIIYGNYYPEMSDIITSGATNTGYSTTNIACCTMSLEAGDIPPPNSIKLPATQLARSEEDLPDGKVSH
jgi:hypothetical protein